MTDSSAWQARSHSPRGRRRQCVALDLLEAVAGWAGTTAAIGQPDRVGYGLALEVQGGIKALNFAIGIGRRFATILGVSQAAVEPFAVHSGGEKFPHRGPASAGGEEEDDGGKDEGFGYGRTSG